LIGALDKSEGTNPKGSANPKAANPKESGRCLLIFCIIGEAEWADFCDQNDALFVAGKQSDLSFSIKKLNNSCG
jgi:hypothetical protein